MQIYCTNLNRYIDFDGGETLSDILLRLQPQIGFRPICARVNNKTEALSYALFAPKMVEFLPRQSASGERTYIRSLCMMLYKAVSECIPGARLRIVHSISKGNFCRIDNTDVPITATLAMQLKEKMRSYTDADIPFKRHEQLTSDVIDIFSRQGLEDKVRLLRTTHSLYTVYYSFDGLCDSYYSALAPSSGHIDVFDLIPYHDGLLLQGFDHHNPDVPPQPVTQHKMYEAFKEYVMFNNIIGVRNVGDLNTAVERHNTSTLINVAEALHDKKIANISNEVTRRYNEGGARVVLIAGPSSSGKTTFTKRLAIQLMTNLLRPRMISLDNYFVDRHLTPKDEDGELDYESLYALDLELFNSHLRTLLSGGEVEMPYYNFAAGTREFRGDKLRLDDRSILLIEGIHGLNPELTRDISAADRYTIYVSALTTLSIDDHNWVPTTDNRLLRRIIRDHKYRGASAVSTLRRWPSVRRGEEKWIFPYQENADSTFNSSLIFELGVMRRYGEEILAQVPRDIPEYAEAYRLRLFLSYFAPIDTTNIPSTSLLREFLGGSSFHY